MSCFLPNTHHSLESQLLRNDSLASRVLSTPSGRHTNLLDHSQAIEEDESFPGIMEVEVFGQSPVPSSIDDDLEGS